MAKRNNKKTTKKTVNIAPQRKIGDMPSEELALLLGEQYKMVMQSQNNITAINSVLEQRGAALAKKATEDGKH